MTPAFSPDGTKIAFYSTRDGDFEVYAMNADGSDQTRLSNNPAEDAQPDWGPAVPERAGAFSCRASSIRAGAGEPVVANPDETPCNDDLAQAAGFPIGVPGVSVSGNSEAKTDQTPDDLDASPPAAGDKAESEASWQTLTLQIGLLKIRVNALTAHAKVACAPDGAGGLKPALTSSSEVAGLRIGAVPLGLLKGHLRLALPGGISLQVNETVKTSDSITQRALRLHTPTSDFVLGEAKADFEGSPCSQ